MNIGVNIRRLVLRRAFIIISASGPVMSTTGREKKYETKIFRTLNNMQQTEYRQVIASTIRYNIGLIHRANASDIKPPFVRDYLHYTQRYRSHVAEGIVDTIITIIIIIIIVTIITIINNIPVK